MPLYLTEEEVTGLVNISDAILAMEQVGESMSKDETIFLPRTRLRMSHGVFHFMPASLEEDGYFGYKAYTSIKGIARFLVFLFDNHSGELRAMVQADRLGQLRTGAASAVASKFLMRKNSLSFGLIGSGYQAETQLAGILAVHKFDSVKIFSRNFDHAKKFAAKFEKMSEARLEVVENIKEAASADVVTTVTSSTSPVLFGEMVNAGCHINAVGGNTLIKRELDEKLVESADLIVIDSREQGEKECGDFLPSLEKGKLHWSDVFEYRDIFRGNARRESDSDITLFKSQGIAPWDIALAKIVYERALQQKVGRQISI